MFLVTTLVVGAAGLFFKNTYFNYESESFDYSRSDSLFLAFETINREADTPKISDKKVDYEQELLDFSKNELLSEKDSKKNKLVNVNTAEIEELMTLPGIGRVTAGRIIDFRNKRNGIKNLDELLLVKGIGESRLRRIKKFLIIE